MQNWIDLYLEHANTLTEKIPKIKWVDLWHNQVNFLAEEHPFDTPAVFLSYRSLNTEDIGEKVQKLKLQVDFYLYYETFADTYKGAHNQDSALEFIDLMNVINEVFHGTSGLNYSEMRRIGFAPIDTGSAGNLYRISYSCILIDYSAKKDYKKTQQDADINLGNIKFTLE